MEFAAAQQLELNCIISTENSLRKKKRSYIHVTLFHGRDSKFEKHTTDFDSKGSANFCLKEVNVECDYLRIQAFNHRYLLPHKHLGDVNILVSDLVLARGEPSSSTYQLGASFGKVKKGNLKLSCKLSSDGKIFPAVVPSRAEKAEMESKRVATAIGNDIALFKMLPSFRTPFVSLNWN